MSRKWWTGWCIGLVVALAVNLLAIQWLTGITVAIGMSGFFAEVFEHRT